MTEENKKPAVKWYHRPVWIAVAIFAAGPFALPMVWLSPALKRWHKVVITILIAAISIWLVQATVAIYKSILKEMTDLQNLMQ